MNHYVLTMRSDAVSPAGGDTKSWFYYYKVGADETFVGIPDTDAGWPMITEPQAQDRLWFMMDGEILFTCLLIEAVHEELHARWELRYNSNELQPVNQKWPQDDWAAEWKTGQVLDVALINWLEELRRFPTGACVPALAPVAPPFRAPHPEELVTLGLIQRNQGEFILVPVKYKGQERYALSVKRNISGEEKAHVLALCFNLEQDDDVIASLDGTIASPLRLVR